MRKFELIDCNYLPVARDKQVRCPIYHAFYEAQVSTKDARPFAQHILIS